ncbi:MULTISPECIES: mercury(II) reductase [Leifsonia]|uniref:mercury(II) reductase n=1 Tax=Leifsonia TaxID=110932 RepID=UPI00092B7261|nr:MULTISPECIES: mercury(II) reductase [Leifsonia]OJX75740.1 MAG: mercury(II) reductase [Leifsonia sp. 71-9]
MPSKYDLAVIGSGGAAFAAAIRATTLGKTVVMIERGTFGGTCINTGCVPSKALIAAAEARHVAADASYRFPGITTSAGPVDVPKLIDGKQELVEHLRGEKYVDVADHYGWQIRQGEAAFAGTPEAPVLQITTSSGEIEAIEAGHYLVATGSEPWAPPIDGLENTGFLTSTTAMEMTELPDSMLILGGGYVALEQAQLFSRLGVQVTLLVRSRLASKEEPEVSKILEQVFADEGIRVVRRAVPVRVARDAVTRQVTVTAVVSGGEREFTADQLMVALGRRPVTSRLNLDTVGVEAGEKGEIVVNDRLRSSHPRVWAAGDVTGHPEFVYVAAAHGTLVAENALAGSDRAIDYSRLPRVTFTSPAVGSVGMTERDAISAGVRCACRVLPLKYVTRALVNRDVRGFIKMVANAETGEILGLTAVSQDAGELAAAGVYVLGKTIDEVADAWAPYLTMAEGIRIVAKAFTTDVSMLSCCA